MDWLYLGFMVRSCKIWDLWFYRTPPDLRGARTWNSSRPPSPGGCRARWCRWCRWCRRRGLGSWWAASWRARAPAWALQGRDLLGNLQGRDVISGGFLRVDLFLSIGSFICLFFVIWIEIICLLLLLHNQIDRSDRYLLEISSFLVFQYSISCRYLIAPLGNSGYGRQVWGSPGWHCYDHWWTMKG